MNFSAVIFDLDGTLLDTETIALRAGVETAHACGLCLPDTFFLGLVGKDGKSVRAELSQVLPAPLDAAEFKDEWETRFNLDAERGIPLKPGVTELLDHLDNLGIPRAVATNSSHDGARRSLERAGLGDRFDHVIGCDMVANPKPAPDVYLAATLATGCEAKDCLAFEDSDLGVEAALAAGLHVVHVPDTHPPAVDRAHVRAGSLLDGARAVGLW